MPELLGDEAAVRIAEAALDLPGADDVEVLLVHDWGGLTRFASSSIHQSTAREEADVRVRVVTDGRIGVASTSVLSPEGARDAAGSALETARLSGRDPGFPGLAPAAEVPATDGYDEATATASPDERARAVEALVGTVEDGFHAAGAYETSAMEALVATTEGQRAYAASTRTAVTTVISGGEGGAGYAEAMSRRTSDIDPEAIGARASEKARASQRPRDVPPGRYEVVLEPAAVTTLLSFLAYLGFGGRSIAEGRSCFTGREGDRVMSERVSIWDDGTSPDTLGLPFDFEGTPKRRTDLIRDGVFVGGVHDRRSAAQAGVQPTGHALPPPNPDGAFPLNLFLATGDATVEEMVAATERGLLVTRFHYANVVQPKEAVITGMTRDGTWLIEDGEIVAPVKNLRFTQSIVEALRDVLRIGSTSELASEFFFAASRVPALHLGAFAFTGASDH